MLRMNFLWIKTWREDREYDRKPERRNRRLEIGKTWNWRKSSGNDFKNFYSTLVLLFRSNLFPKSFLENFYWFCLTKFKLGILVSLKNNYYLTRIVYLRCLSVVTFTAFAVAYNQNRGRDPNPNLTQKLIGWAFRTGLGSLIEGLIGSRGLTPANEHMIAVKNHFRSDQYGKWRQVVGPHGWQGRLHL